jgi:murein L,D-transpeptidase YcbB/YkuD
LGQVKFIFPNRHNVYLHDTPTQGTFASADRAVSSGCIRLSDPMVLAEWLLAGPGRPQTKSPGQIASILESAVETTVRLPAPVPVHLLYWTAWVDTAGHINYTGDIYQRDGKVLEALQIPPPSRH